MYLNNLLLLIKICAEGSLDIITEKFPEKYLTLVHICSVYVVKLSKFDFAANSVNREAYETRREYR